METPLSSSSPPDTSTSPPAHPPFPVDYVTPATSPPSKRARRCLIDVIMARLIYLCLSLLALISITYYGPDHSPNPFTFHVEFFEQTSKKFCCLFWYKLIVGSLSASIVVSCLFIVKYVVALIRNQKPDSGILHAWLTMFLQNTAEFFLLMAQLPTDINYLHALSIIPGGVVAILFGVGILVICIVGIGLVIEFVFDWNSGQDGLGGEVGGRLMSRIFEQV